VPNWNLKERSARKLKSLENKYDEQFRVVFEAIYKLMETPGKKKRGIGCGREGRDLVVSD
jgi:hypothetical protein